MQQPRMDIAMKVVDHVDAMLGYWDRDLRCHFVNASYEECFGRSREEILRMSKQDLLGPMFDSHLPHIQGVLNGQVQVFERDLVLPDGHIRHTLTAYYPDIVDEVVQGFSVQVTDVTRMKNLELELLAAKSQAEVLATHDFLTGLPNRVLLMDRIAAATTHAERNGGVAGVIAIDIDEFKEINDTHGHQVGDCVLKEIARRMAGSIRATDTVTRLGGDEFIFLASEVEGVAGIQAAIHRLQHAVHQPMHCHGTILTPTISCGAAVFPHNGTTPSELLSRADSALYEAKRQGKRCFVFAA